MLNKEKVENIINLYNSGKKVTRKQTIFKDNIIGLRKSNISYDYNHQEKVEYAKCYNNIYYFIEKYLNIKLYKYQKEIIEHYKNNRFPIYMTSREMNFNRIISCIIIHEIIFNIEYSFLLIYNKTSELIEHSDMIKDLYLQLPFFLQVGINIWNMNNISLDNGNRISFRKISKNVSIGSNYNNIMLFGLSEYNDKNTNNLLKNIIPIQSVIVDNKLLIHSQPNGLNLFYKLVQDSERKENDKLKNMFSTLRTYWWEYPNRDEIWKKDKINNIGKSNFSKYYDLFIS